MAKTETELATAVLKHLSVIGAGQNPEASEIQDVIDAYRAKYDELTAPGYEYTYWELAEIPEPIFTTLRDLVALEVRNGFGQPIEASAKELEEAVILKRLRRHVGIPSTGLPAVSEYM